MRFTNGFDPAFVDRVFFRAGLWRLKKSAPQPGHRERDQWKGERHPDENDDKQIRIRGHLGLDQIRSETVTAKLIFSAWKRGQRNFAVSVRLKKRIAIFTKTDR